MQVRDAHISLWFSITATHKFSFLISQRLPPRKSNAISCLFFFAKEIFPPLVCTCELIGHECNVQKNAHAGRCISIHAFTLLLATRKLKATKCAELYESRLKLSRQKSEQLLWILSSEQESIRAIFYRFIKLHMYTYNVYLRKHKHDVCILKKKFKAR